MEGRTRRRASEDRRWLESKILPNDTMPDPIAPGSGLLVMKAVLTVALIRRRMGGGRRGREMVGWGAANIRVLTTHAAHCRAACVTADLSFCSATRNRSIARIRKRA